MKHILLFIFLSVSAYATSAQSASLVWAKQFGGPDAQQNTAVYQDPFGNFIFSGYFYGTVDFNPSSASNTLSSNGTKDAYVCKLDANGNYMWAVSFGGVGDDEAWDVATDNFGNVIVVGSFTSASFDADPGANTVTLTTVSYYSSAFVIKLDANGTYQWSQAFTSPQSFSYVSAKAVHADSNGNITIGGQMNLTQFDAVDFNPGIGSNTLNENHHYFILKLTPNGVYVNVIGLEGSYNYIPNFTDMIVDGESNVYFSGEFFSIIDFDPSPVDFEVNGNGYYVAFVCKLSGSGELQWVSTIQDAGNSIYTTSLLLDNNDNVYLTGTFKEVVDFNPDFTGTNELVGYTGYDNGYILKLNENGEYIYAKNMANGPGSTCRDVTIDDNYNLYVIGNFTGTADLNSNEGEVANYTVSGSDNVFVTKLNDEGEYVYSNTFGSAGIEEGRTIFFDTTTNSYLAIGSFTNSMDVDPNTGVANMTSAGNSDIFIIRFSECSPVTTSFSDVGCGSYEWNGQAYTVSGTYQQAFIATSGCDSLATLNLTIASATSSSITVEACAQYVFNGEELEVSGNYISTFTNAQGCDSLVYLNLTIGNYPEVALTINGNTISATSTATSFQWFNCDNNQVIEGATSASYSPTQSGSYGVYANLGPCTEQECTNFTYTGVKELGANSISLYPNPAEDNIFINCSSALNNAILHIINSTGSIVMSNSIKGNGMSLDVSSLPSGIYFIQCVSNGVMMQERFAKK